MSSEEKKMGLPLCLQWLAECWKGDQGNTLSGGAKGHKTVCACVRACAARRAGAQRGMERQTLRAAGFCFCKVV